jgi:hypothetical protein
VAAFENVRRAMKPGGRLALAVFRAGVEVVWGPKFGETYSRAEICDPNGYHIELRQWFTGDVKKSRNGCLGAASKSSPPSSALRSARCANRTKGPPGGHSRFPAYWM